MLSHCVISCIIPDWFICTRPSCEKCGTIPNGATLLTGRPRTYKPNGYDTGNREVQEHSTNRGSSGCSSTKPPHTVKKSVIKLRSFSSVTFFYLIALKNTSYTLFPALLRHLTLPLSLISIHLSIYLNNEGFKIRCTLSRSYSTNHLKRRYIS